MHAIGKVGLQVAPNSVDDLRSCRDLLVLSRKTLFGR